MVSKKKREACKRNGFQVNHGNTHSKTVGNKNPRKSAQNEPVQQPNSQESPELSKTRSGSQPTVTEKKKQFHCWVRCPTSFDVFRSARTSCRTFDFPTRPVPSVRNNFSRVHIYRHTCLMNHQKSHQTNPMAQRDPIDAPLTPWDPVGLPLDPLGPCRPTPWPPDTLWAYP